MIILAYLVIGSILLTLLIMCFFGDQIYNKTRDVYLRTVGKKVYPCHVYDELMIPRVNYGGDIGIQSNPVTVAQEAMKYYDIYKNGSPDQKQYFFNCIDWLLKNKTIINQFPFWEYNFNHKKYGLKSPWRSGMAQGRVLQALVLAYKETGSQAYYDLGAEIIDGFFLTIDQNGTTRQEADNKWWYEEYAHPEGVKSKVLNGMIVSLLGIWDYYEISHSEKAKDIFERGVNAVKASLPLYDKKDGSYYDLVGNISSNWYHQFHIDLLKDLFRITKEPIFMEFAEKWESNPPLTPGFWVKWFSKKSKKSFKLVAFIFVIIFSVVLFTLLAIHYYFIV